MEPRALRRARDRLYAAAQEELSGAEVCAKIIRSFHEVAVFDCCAVMTTDSETLLPSGGVVEGFSPELCAPFWNSELLDLDCNRFSVLARRADPVASLAESLDGDFERSPRYQKLYASLAPADELRVVFVAGSSCLAVGVFLRPSGKGPFSAAELTAVRKLVAPATTALRRALGRLVQESEGASPVVILLGEEDRLVGMTAGGAEVVDDLRTDDIDDQELPSLIRIAAARVRGENAGGSVTTRVRGRSGRWLRLHAAGLDGQESVVAVTVDAARSDDLVSILLDSYGLTDREVEIVLLLCRGLAVKDIAAELSISPHTVRDYTKAIYEKTGVGSRGELVARLFSGHVLERFHASVTHVA